MSRLDLGNTKKKKKIQSENTNLKVCMQLLQWTSALFFFQHIKAKWDMPSNVVQIQKGRVVLSKIRRSPYARKHEAISWCYGFPLLCHACQELKLLESSQCARTGWGWSGRETAPNKDWGLRSLDFSNWSSKIYIMWCIKLCPPPRTVIWVCR